MFSLRDAYNLTWKLAHVLQRGGDERPLDTYESERKPHARYVIRLAVAMGWAMTGGQDDAAALRRGLLAAACRIPGLAAAAGRDLSPPLTAGPLVRRRLRGGLAGTHCPQPWITAEGRRTRLDELLGDSFAILTGTEPWPSLNALAHAIGVHPIPVNGLGDDGTLAARLRAGRADAVLLRPDRVVMDIVPAGGRDFTGTATWAPLLHTARTLPARRNAGNSLREERRTMSVPEPFTTPGPHAVADSRPQRCRRRPAAVTALPAPQGGVHQRPCSTSRGRPAPRLSGASACAPAVRPVHGLRAAGRTGPPGRMRRGCAPAAPRARRRPRPAARSRPRRARRN